MKRPVPWKPGEREHLTAVLVGRTLSDVNTLRTIPPRVKSEAELAAEAKRARKAAKYSQSAKGK